MKKIYQLLSFCLLPLLMAACKDDFGNIQYPDGPLILSVQEQEIVLEVAHPESDAITFSWTSGSNFGSNAAIQYVLELATKEDHFEHPIQSEWDKGTTSVGYRTDEFNQLLIEQLGIEPGSEVELAARVTAHVQAEGIAPQVSDPISIKVKTYKPITSTLYLIGSATPNGWSADDATKMNAVQGSAGSFVWQGVLTAGEFKMITDLGSFAPSYNKGNDNEHLYYRASIDDDYDEPFYITEAGAYQIKVNLIDLSISITPMEGAAYNELWFVGGFTGWSFQPMVRDANDPFIFRYHAVLNADAGADEFKIATKPDFDPSVVFLRPETNQQGPGTGLPVVSWSESENNNDFKWHINSGTYKIKLDLKNNQIDIVPFVPYPQLYLVGDAAPNGWDINAATPLNKGTSAYVFTWTGTLKVGEFKFSCDQQADWNGAWFLASQNGMTPSGEVEQMLFSNPGSNPDNKWKITAAGTYTITLDQLQETVIIKKQ